MIARRILPRLLEGFHVRRCPLLVEMLVKDGPYGLYEMACRRYGYSALEDGYAGKCHLCVDVRKHLVEAGQFEELSPRGFYTALMEN
ncbi:MAG: hypothetical protein AB1894_00590 [Chloroflexota bacterium]